MENPITTIEDLAVMIVKTMASKEDVKRVEDRLTGVEGRLTGVEGRLTGVESQLTGVEGRLDTLDARVGRIEADIHELRGEIVYRHEFQDALDRIKYLEKKAGIESGM